MTVTLFAVLGISLQPFCRYAWAAGEKSDGGRGSRPLFIRAEYMLIISRMGLMSIIAVSLGWAAPAESTKESCTCFPAHPERHENTRCAFPSGENIDRESLIAPPRARHIGRADWI